MNYKNQAVENIIKYSKWRLNVGHIEFNSLNANKFPIFQLILMMLVSKFMVHRALSGNTYLTLGLLSLYYFALKLRVIHIITNFDNAIYRMTILTLVLHISELCCTEYSVDPDDFGF